MPLRRDDVITAAVELFDEVGLDAFTTRALTDRLGVQRGALYWHVKSKHELLSAVTARIIAPAFLSADNDRDTEWTMAFAGFAQRLRTAMLAHRDAARLMVNHPPLDQEILLSMSSNLDWLEEHGIPKTTAARFGDLITSYVTGYVLQEQAQQSVGTPNDLAESNKIFTASVATIILGMRAELAKDGSTAVHHVK